MITATALALLGGCGGADGGSPSGSADTDGDTAAANDLSSTAATGPVRDVEDTVLEDYETAKQALYAAFDPPTPDAPDLLAYWDGEALATAQDLLRQLEVGGVSWVGAFETDAIVASVVGDEAVVEDCVVDRVQPVDVSTGAPVGDESESVTHIESHLELIGDTWKIVQEEELSEPCTPS